MKEYIIRYEPSILEDGSTKDNYNVYYFDNGQPSFIVPEKEFYCYSLDNPIVEIRDGYIKNSESL